uniref:DUF2577 domain-containing protein n=1 Tax=Dulem virus 37 TaxID=3145755 RepID=A0AAU8AX28_9CAUD
MAEVSEKTSIKQLIQGMTGDGVEVIQGTVKSVNPLKIQIVNDNKLTISSAITYIPRHLTDYTTTVDIVQGTGSLNSGTAKDGSHTHAYSGETDSGGDPAHTHSYNGTTQGSAHSHALSSFNIYKATMTVYNALKVGETVHILSFNHGKQYYVLDRIEG